jgi:hypothetical protein
MYISQSIGHYQYDQLLDGTIGDKFTYFGLTNQEILDHTNPTSAEYKMSYIYNDFDWSHCTQAFGEDMNFDTLLNALPAQIKSLQQELSSVYNGDITQYNKIKNSNNNDNNTVKLKNGKSVPLMPSDRMKNQHQQEKAHFDFGGTKNGDN